MGAYGKQIPGGIRDKKDERGYAMRCLEFLEKLFEMAYGTLSEEEEQTCVTHAQVCSACRNNLGVEVRCDPRLNRYRIVDCLLYVVTGSNPAMYKS